MMKKIILLLLLLSFEICEAQNHNRERMWVLPDSAGINFNTVTPTIFSSNESGCFTLGDGTQLEAIACISDTSGQLLFYSNGFKLYDKNNNLMPHGDSIWCDISGTNSIIIIPKPLNDSLYFLFYINPGFNNSSEGIYYSIINMNKNGGSGDVEINMKNKEAFLIDSLAEQITAIKHGNGRDWWVVGKKSNGFFKILITPEGIVDTNYQQFGFGSSDGWSAGEITVSQNGNKIGSCIHAIHTLEQLDFDRCSGQLSNLSFYNFNPAWNIEPNYGCSFSPNGNILYCTTFDTLYQLKKIGNSLQVTYKFVNPYHSDGYYFSQMQLAPDNKIYFTLCYANNPSFNFSLYNMNLCTINSPDSFGSNCNVLLNNFNLGGKRCSFGLPNMPNYDLGRLSDSPCDTLYNSVNNKISLEKSIIRIYPNPTSDELTIEVLNGIAPKQIEITDATGRLMMKFIQTKPNQQVNIKSLSAGVYFIKVQMQDGSVAVRKFVKE